MKPCPENLLIRQPQLDDYDGILNITIDEDLWGGMDYLPFALKSWLKEGEDKKSNRENFVFTLFGRIVGFMSIYFLNAGKVGAKFAFRVSKDIRGKGYGRQVNVLLQNYLKEHYAKLQNTISAIPDMDLNDDEIKSCKHGNLLTSKSYPTYKINLGYLSTLVIETCKETFFIVSNTHFSEMLRGKHVQHLLRNNLLHINWTPVLIETDDDINFATRKKQIVLAKRVSESNISSFSILTLPFNVPNGNFKASIDIYTGDEDKQGIESHIKLQLMNLKQNLGNASQDNHIFLHIIVDENLGNAVFDVMKNFEYLVTSETLL